MSEGRLVIELGRVATACVLRTRPELSLLGARVGGGASEDGYTATTVAPRERRRTQPTSQAGIGRPIFPAQVDHLRRHPDDQSNEQTCLRSQEQRRFQICHKWMAIRYAA